MKPKFVILLVIGILITTQLFNLFSYSQFHETVFQNPGHSTKNSAIVPDVTQPVQIIYNKAQLEDFLNSSTHSNLTRWKLSFILRLRKLVLWSVREVNLRIQGQECTRWWANPLSVNELRVLNVTNNVTKYSLTFEVHPGGIPFETVVNVQRHNGERADGLYEPEELTLVSGRRLDVVPKPCGTVPQSLHAICLCLEERVPAEEKTRIAREKWKVSDPELVTWPPNMSFLLPDYFSLGTMDIYLKSPKKSVEYCGPNLKIIIFVSSSPKNFEGRMGIRNSYGDTASLKEQGAKLLFGFDKDPDTVLQRKIDEEFEQFDDIIQASHSHSYHNLSFRDLTMPNWLVTQCRLQNAPLPQWFIKTDDDYFINVPRALEVAAANPDVEAMGVGNCGQPVIRDISYMTKYYTPRYIYPAKTYTGYLSGATWLIRSDVLTLILAASLTTPLLHVDDVYVMGMLTREVGIRPRGVSVMSYGREAGACRTKEMINSAVTNATDFAVLWKYLHEPLPENCTLTNDIKASPVDQYTIDVCLFA